MRDLTRCRDDVRADIVRWRHRVLKLLARHGRVYQAGKNWSQAHWTWIRAQHFADGALARTLEASLEGLEQALRRRAELDRAIEGLADDPRYRAAVDDALRCFRGINTLSAMILVAELVDFQRFIRPRALMAYLGLVPSEYSSGDRHRRGAPSPRLATPMLAASSWRPPGIIVIVRPSATDWLVIRPTKRRPSSPGRGALSSGCIGATAVGHGKRPTVAVAAVAREWPVSCWPP